MSDTSANKLTCGPRKARTAAEGLDPTIASFASGTRATIAGSTSRANHAAPSAFGGCPKPATKTIHGTSGGSRETGAPAKA